MKSSILIVLLLVLLCTPAIAATNYYTIIRTTTSELSNGAWYDVFTISSDQISLYSGDGRYQSVNLNVPNISKFNVTTSGYSASSDTLSYAMVGSNYVWLNATDYRWWMNPGHAAYSNKYSMTAPLATTGATLNDEWFTNGGTSEGLVLAGNTQVIPGSVPSQNYLLFDGTDDIATAPMIPVPMRSYWNYGAMVWPNSTGGTTMCALSLTNSTYPTSIYCYVELATSGSNYYWKLSVRDYAGHTGSWGNTAKSVTKNTYHYVEVVSYENTIYVFDNGVYQTGGSFSSLTSSGTITDTIVIGGRLGAGGAVSNDFKGRIDNAYYGQGTLEPTFGDNQVNLANDTLFATHMWNDVLGVSNSFATEYPSRISYSGESYIVIHGTGSLTIPEYSYTVLNNAPIVVSIFPDGVDYEGEVILDVNVTDADISYITPTSVNFYVDGELQGTSTRSSNGEITRNIGSPTGGEHEWYALVYDPWGGSVLTDTYTFGIPADLYIRDEEDSDNLITGAEVHVSFYTENTSLVRTSTNGTISLYGLPTSNMLVSATAEGYIPRKTIIFSLYDTNSIYLLNESADVIYQKFVLNTQTITGSPTDYILRIQKPMNGTVDTVFSSYFDFDGSCGTYLLKSDVYQLVIVAPDGTESSYGYLYPDPDGQIDIAFQGITFNEYVNAWLSANTTINRDVKSISYAYEQADQSNSLNPILITEATMIVIDEGNNTVYNVTVTDSSYVFQYSAAAEGRYTVDIEILGEDEDGNEFSYTKSFVVDFIDDHFQFMPDAYPDWLKMLIITFLSLLVLVGFGGYRSDLACGLSFGLYAFSAYQEWISVGSLALGVMFIIVMAAFFKLQRKNKRGA